MPEVALIINVNNSQYDKQRGVLGVYSVPPMKDGNFGLLVVRARGEVQDVGNGNRKVNEIIPARKLAEDILGWGSERMEKIGLLVCEAEPDEPKDLEKAERAERDYLNLHPPEIRQRMNPVLRVREVVNMQDLEPGAKEEKLALSQAVQKARQKFESYCRTLVKESEISLAIQNLLREDQRIVAEADGLWAQENTRKEVTVKHHNACRRLHQERPWFYSPQQMEDCGACGKAVKSGVAICSYCGAILDEKKAKQFKIGPYAVQNPRTQPGA